MKQPLTELNKDASLVLFQGFHNSYPLECYEQFMIGTSFMKELNEYKRLNFPSPRTHNDFKGIEVDQVA